MDGISRFFQRITSRPAEAPAAPQQPAATEAPRERPRLDLFSHSRFESGDTARALSEPAVRQPPPPPPPDASQEARDEATQKWVEYCNQFKTSALTELTRKKDTHLPDAAADRLMHGGKSSPVYPAGRSTVPGNQDVPAFFQDFPSSQDRQMQLYTFCRPPPGEALNPSDRKQWVSFEVYGDICKAYSDPRFTSGKEGTNSVLGFPDSGRENALATKEPFLEDPLVKDLIASQQGAGKTPEVPFQRFQNGFLVDLGGKVQAFTLDGKRLGTAWPDGSMATGGTTGPGGPQAPTGPYGTYGVNTGDTRFGNEVVQLGTSNRFGGAIDSLVYDGKEYINNDDHGRQMQVAFSLDGHNEALMPTEAGNHDDKDGPTSSSKLVGVGVEPGGVTTTVHPAYWLKPGQKAGDYNGPDATVAVNTTVVSDDTITKNVKVGVGGHPNVIQYDSHIHLAAPHEKAYVEAPTTYLNHDFEKHYRFDPATGQTREYPRVHSENPPPTGFSDEAGNVPLIVATPDGKHAMAMWSPNEDRGDLQYRLHQFDFSKEPWTGGSSERNTSKMGVTFGMSSGVPPDIQTRTYVIVGTVEEVKARLQELYQQNPTNVDRVWPEDVKR